MTRRVLVYDPYQDQPWAVSLRAAIIGSAGSDVEVSIPADPAIADAELPAADVVIVTGRRRLGDAQLAAMVRAVGIVCFSVGTDQVDAAAAAAAGIPVANVPDYCTDEVADHAMALLLAAQRRLIPLATETGGGRWTGHTMVDASMIHRLRGKTLGILGAGRVGQAVADRARPFGVSIIAHDPVLDKGASSPLPAVSLADLAARSHALVLCAALTPQSRGIIGAQFLDQVHDGLILVNVARGGLVDEVALLAALDEGRVAVAALDVRAVEPPDPASDPLAGRADVIVTPHFAGTSVEAFDELLVKTGDRVHELLAAPRERAGVLR